MKQTPVQYQTLLKGDKSAYPSLVLIYGDDGGVVRELAKETISGITQDPDDPFSHDKIAVDELTQGISRLVDSATMVSFGEKPRLVRVEGVHGDLPASALDALTEAVSYLLETPLQDVVVLIPAPRIDSKKSLIRLIEKHKTAVAVRCFQDNARDMRGVILQFYAAKKKTVSADAMAFLLEHLGNDRDITLNELEKLDLYTGASAEVTLNDCLEMLSNAPAANVFKWCDAVGNAQYREADRYYRQFLEEGEEPQGLQVLLHRHQRRLYSAALSVQAGGRPDEAMRSLVPPVMFNQPVFQSQFMRMLQAGNGKALKSDTLGRLWQDVWHARSQVTEMQPLLYASTLHLK